MKQKIRSFNMQEMLVVLCIIGILLLLVIPNLMPLITKAKSIEAQTQLKAIYNMEKQHFYMYSKYAPEFSEIDFELPKTANAGGSANYSYEIIEAGSNTFKARATAVVDFDGDGVFNVWEIDQDGNPKQVTND